MCRSHCHQIIGEESRSSDVGLLMKARTRIIQVLLELCCTVYQVSLLHKYVAEREIKQLAE